MGGSRGQGISWSLRRSRSRGGWSAGISYPLIQRDLRQGAGALVEIQAELLQAELLLQEVAQVPLQQVPAGPLLDGLRERPRHGGCAPRTARRDEVGVGRRDGSGAGPSGGRREGPEREPPGPASPLSAGYRRGFPLPSGAPAAPHTAGGAALPPLRAKRRWQVAPSSLGHRRRHLLGHPRARRGPPRPRWAAERCAERGAGPVSGRRADHPPPPRVSCPPPARAAGPIRAVCLLPPRAAPPPLPNAVTGTVTFARKWRREAEDAGAEAAAGGAWGGGVAPEGPPLAGGAGARRRGPGALAQPVAVGAASLVNGPGGGSQAGRSPPAGRSGRRPCVRSRSGSGGPPPGLVGGLPGRPPGRGAAGGGGGVAPRSCRAARGGGAGVTRGFFGVSKPEWLAAVGRLRRAVASSLVAFSSFGICA